MVPVNVPAPLTLVLAVTVRVTVPPAAMLLALWDTVSQFDAVVAVIEPEAVLVTVTNCW